MLGIVYGGKSSEHEVSLRTAFSILQALDYDRWSALPLYIQLDGKWREGKPLNQPPEHLEQLRLAGEEAPHLFHLKEKVDIVFPVVHGPYGEDGTLQGLLEMLDLPYVGSGVLASSVGMDKVMMKKMFSCHHIPQVDFLAFSRREIEADVEEVCSFCQSQLGFPLFVKPANLGSSVGISKAKTSSQLRQALLEAARFDHKVIVEAFADGRELEIGVLGNHKGDVITSVVGEVVSHGEFYDYDSKYRDGGAQLFIPASIPAHVSAEIARLATEAFLALECKGLARVDFFWNEKEDRIYLNEINTLPGFTRFSMYPQLFQQAGWSYPRLIERLIELGFEHYEEKKRNQVSVSRLD